MNGESRLVLEVWDGVRDYIPVAKREDIAAATLRAYVDYGFDPEDLADLVGEDRYLEEAYNLLYGSDEDEIPDDDEDNYDEYED